MVPAEGATAAELLPRRSAGVAQIAAQGCDEKATRQRSGILLHILGREMAEIHRGRRMFSSGETIAGEKGEILLTPLCRLLVCAPAFLEKRAHDPCLKPGLAAGDWGGGFRSLREEWRSSLAQAGPGAEMAESFFGKKPQ
jgi:hypothetical protein